MGRVGLESLRFATRGGPRPTGVAVVGSLAEEIQKSLVLKDIRPGTRRSYLSSLRPFYDLNMETLTVSALHEVLYDIQNQNSRRKTIIALKSLVPHPAVKALRVPEATSRVYDLPDETSLRLALMTCTHETRALLMAYAGLRCGEACAVTAASLDGRWLVVDRQMDELTRKVVPVKTTAARVPLPLWLVPHVSALEVPVNPKAVRKSLSRAGKRVGLDLNPHQLRHWYATTLVNRGTPPNVVQRLMRHKDIRVTFKVYAQVAQADLTTVVDDLGRLG